MEQSNDIAWIRRFYRAHLARYKWAQLLKQVYLALRLLITQLRGFLVWHINYKLARSASYFSHVGNSSNSPVLRQSSKLAAFFSCTLLRGLYALTNQEGSWYTTHNFSEYQKLSQTARLELAHEREVSLVMPKVYPEEFKKFLHNDLWSLHVPPICAYEFFNIQIMGKSDLLFLENQCLHHELYRFDRDFLFEEIHEFININAHIKKLVRLKGKQIGSIPSGISLLGSTSANYVHWLTETLPKLALVDSVEAYKDLPYIIDAGLHPNILESVQHLNFSGRKVIYLSQGEILTVEKLVAISPVCYVPFEFKPYIKPENLNINPSSAFFSPDGLQRVRQLLVTRLGDTDNAPKRRLFLRRSGKSRPMINYEEVETLVQELGFEIVEPEKLNFAEQVRLFSNANTIIGQGGAALGNLIFAPADCHVIVLTTWSPYIIHYYFSNLATIMDQRCTLVMCDPIQSEPGQHRAHMGLRIPLSKLKKAIGQ